MFWILCAFLELEALLKEDRVKRKERKREEKINDKKFIIKSSKRTGSKPPSRIELDGTAALQKVITVLAAVQPRRMIIYVPL